MSDQITPKVRNKTPISETDRKYCNSRFNALKHSGYATHFHTLTEEEKQIYWEKKWKQKTSSSLAQ